MNLEPQIILLGESAIVFRWNNTISKTVASEVHAFAAWLAGQKIAGIDDIIPAYASVTVLLDLRTFLGSSHGQLPLDFFTTINQQFQHQNPYPDAESQVVVEIPVCYDPLLSNDLDTMSASLGISTDTIINLHASGEYFVYMLGFLPGFAYMGDVDDRIACPRKEKPVPVKKGAVAIAGKQTGIYPGDSPGGWNIVGYTPLTLFDAGKQPPCLIQPGSAVSFKPIDITTYHSLNQP